LSKITHAFNSITLAAVFDNFMTAAIHAIYVYPIKSMAGVSLDSSFIQPWGLNGDREYMLVDNQGVFLSQRTVPQMALVHISFSENGLQLDAASLGESRKLNISPDEFKIDGRVEIWKQQTAAYYTDSDVDTFFSDLFHQRCRLVRMPVDHRRVVQHQTERIETSFADSLPLMVANRSSLDALNSRLVANGSPAVRMDRFRPNLVLDGIPAFAEDNVASFQIKQSTLRLLKACSRCILVNVNQQTAEVFDEPLKTLSTFRRVQNKVNFGVHTSPGNCSDVISVGDFVNCVSAGF
jgi:uncharacterized protein YcbX